MNSRTYQTVVLVFHPGLTSRCAIIPTLLTSLPLHYQVSFLIEMYLSRTG